MINCYLLKETCLTKLMKYLCSLGARYFDCVKPILTESYSRVIKKACTRNAGFQKRFLSINYLVPNFVHPLNQLASSPDGAIAPMKSTFLMKGRAVIMGSSK